MPTSASSLMISSGSISNATSTGRRRGRSNEIDKPGHDETSVAERVRQPQRQRRHEGDHQEAEQQQAEIAEDRLHGLLDRHIADEARAKKSEPEDRGEEADPHRDQIGRAT